MTADKNEKYCTDVQMIFQGSRKRPLHSKDIIYNTASIALYINTITPDFFCCHRKMQRSL